MHHAYGSIIRLYIFFNFFFILPSWFNNTIYAWNFDMNVRILYFRGRISHSAMIEFTPTDRIEDE